jgi:hypothetical protein
VRKVRRWRLLLAHDASAATCNPLVDSLGSALGDVELYESASMDDARDAVDSGRFDLGLVCLDLPPAPTGGARLAEELLATGLPIVLVTRSLRWRPASAVVLRALPWVRPDATVPEVARAVTDALTARVPREAEEGERISALG